MDLLWALCYRYRALEYFQMYPYHTKYRVCGHLVTNSNSFHIAQVVRLLMGRVWLLVSVDSDPGITWVS